MEKHFSHDIEQSRRPNFSKKLRHDLRKYAPKLDFPDTDHDFIVEILDLMHDKYGDSSKESYLLYHNDLHGNDVRSRSLRLAVLFQKVALKSIDDHTIILSQIAAAGHDIIQKKVTSTPLTKI